MYTSCCVVSVVLLLTLVFSNTCFSASFITENGILAEEDTNNIAKFGVYIVSGPMTDAPKPHIIENSSSEESGSNEDMKAESESGSDESKSSSEENLKRTKRSLDSKQDSPNTIGNNANQTSKTEIGGSSSTKFLSEIKEEQETTITDDVENITPSADDSTTKTSDEDKSHNDAESENEEPPTTTEVDIETTTELEQQTTIEAEETSTEVEAIATTTTETINPGDENFEDFLNLNVTTTESVSDNSEGNTENSMMDQMMVKVNKLSDQIRLVLTHFRNTSAVVIPGQHFFQDPMPLQDFQQSISVGTLQFKSMSVHGLSNFTVEHVNTDVDRMQVYILLHMKRLVILGNYTLKTFWSRAQGPFNVTLVEVDSEGVAEVATAAEGHLEATDSDMDMNTKDMLVDFKNLGFLGSVFQGAIGAVGDAIFNSLKPQILERVNLVIRTDVNKKLKEFSIKFINKVAPVDLAFSEGRKYARSQGYDPYHTKDHSFILGGLVYVNISEFVVEGLSKFYRVGNLSISMDNGTIEIGVHVTTEKLTGHCNWSGQTFGLTKYGKTNFTVDHLQVRALVTQSLDVRKKPQLKDLDLELGWVKVTMDSPLSLNMMIEGVINAFPRLIRHIIVDTLEQPLKEKIQEILNKINVESIVDEHLPRLDSYGL